MEKPYPKDDNLSPEDALKLIRKAFDAEGSAGYSLQEGEGTIALTRKELLEDKGEKTSGVDFAVIIDKDELSRVIVPEIPEDVTEWELKEFEIMRANLERTLEAIRALPERLEFKPGITLIVGPNGLGKSTLAKALCLVAQLNDQLKRSDKYAYEQTFGSTGGLRTFQETFLRGAGFGPEIAKSMRTEKFTSAQLKMYVDFSDFSGRSTEKLEKYRFSDQIHLDESIYRRYIQSNRQMVDSLSKNDDDNWAMPDKDQPRIAFFDEPEVGMDPIRHKAIIDHILSLEPEGSLIIVPTNSVVLYDSDLPRIDLTQPEKGVFVPSKE